MFSGVVMASVSLGLTFWRPEGFNFLVLLAAAIMSWEWSKIIHTGVPGLQSKMAMGLQIGSVIGAILVFIGVGPAYGLGVLLIGAIILLVLAQPGLGALAFLGPFYTGLPAVSLIWLRGDPDYGVAVIIFIFLVVWMADIAAYAVGRTVGGPKLSPRISPNKTWSGGLGGLMGSAIVGMLTANYLGNSSILYLGLVALVLAVASQIGDLYESSIKRRFGVKDSSHLIPGHGGILDRVDGLIVTACLAALIALFVNPALPGRAILIW